MVLTVFSPISKNVSRGRWSTRQRPFFQKTIFLRSLQEEGVHILRGRNPYREDSHASVGAAR